MEDEGRAHHSTTKRESKPIKDWAGSNPQIQYISSSFASRRWTQQKKEMLNLFNSLATLHSLIVFDFDSREMNASSLLKNKTINFIPQYYLIIDYEHKWNWWWVSCDGMEELLEWKLITHNPQFMSWKRMYEGAAIKTIPSSFTQLTKPIKEITFLQLFCFIGFAEFH